MLNTLISTKTNLPTSIVDAIIWLIEEGNTIPFIARYRKEVTDGATDTQLRDFEDIYNYQKKLADKKADLLRILAEKEVLTPELETAIAKAETLSQLEDIYRPYKDKKNTRATKAIAKWLQPLADILLSCEVDNQEFKNLAQTYIKDTGDIKTSVTTLEEAIAGAQDIVAEIIADSPELRNQIKTTQANSLTLETKATKHFEENSVYENYKDYSKALSQMPSYAYLAIARAEKEKQLRVKINFHEAKSLLAAKEIFVPNNPSDLEATLAEAILDSIKRLLHPSLEREFRSDKKEQSDREAIDIFGKNVEELLLSSPVKGKNIMWFDPAYRTGCKIAVIDATGAYLSSTVIYPTKPQENTAWSEKVMLELIAKHDIWLICIGNGTASRESEQFVAQVIKNNDLSCKYLVVSEAGASVYSASKLANEEYPDLDVTIRGAINIAQRVQDPLATYIKIDPKSLGVWQYQHDVDQKLLWQKLDLHIEDAVNRVWVDINTASRALLQHIAWLSTKMAKSLVDLREELGTITSRSQIKKAKWLWTKAFEQCAWFLRISAARTDWWSVPTKLKEPLDSTGIHPESYKITYEILEKECNITKKKLILPYIFPAEKDIATLAQTYEIGEETLIDIIRELANPGLDPREEFDEAWFKSDVLTIDDLQRWMMLNGVVRNIVDFGAFVDIWLKNDGLVHKSQMWDRYVTNVFDVVNVWQQIEVYVTEIDMDRKRVSLSMRTPGSSTPPRINKRPLDKGLRGDLKSQPIKKAAPIVQPEKKIGGNIKWG